MPEIIVLVTTAVTCELLIKQMTSKIKAQKAAFN